MAAIKGGKVRKEQTFHCHGEAKRKDIRTASKTISRKSTFWNRKNNQKKKDNTLHRHAIRSELRRALNTDSGTTNTSMGAVLQGTAAVRETFVGGRGVIRTAKRVRDITKQVKHYKMLHPKEKLLQVNFRKRQLKVLGKDQKKQLVKGGIGLTKEFGKNTKEAIVASLDSSGTTNTGAGSIHMTVRATEVTVDTIRTGKKVYKTAKRIREFHQKSKAKKKAAKVAASKLQQGTKRKLWKVAGDAVKNVLMRQPVVIAAILTGGILFSLLISVMASSTFSMATMNFILMDEKTAAKYQVEMQKLEDSFQKKINDYQKKPGYDDVRIDYMCESGELKPNWAELLAIMAVEFEQDLSFLPEEQRRMSELFNMMNVIKTRTEHFFCSGCCTCGQSALHCHGNHVRLIVEVYAYGMDEIPLNLDEDEMEWARNLATSDLSDLFPAICPPNETIPPEILADLIANAPSSCVTREEIRQTALSLVGRVKYFWGGKSAAGWNKSWGKSVKVTSPGDSTTGTYQPYGLDCSGFTDWVYKTAGVGNLLSGGSAHQWNVSYPISEKDLQVGDLVFKQPPGTGKNHVGIYVGKNESGKKFYCHCAWTQGVTVDSYKGFKYFRRPYVKFDEPKGKGL
ncbi:C40 family peptidase [Sinanaerobacter sp. ZZT-01]|uniref:C40 family peptidase n=1 Tax=Sinanaerobacter sp. ZZT-01 TaxID=3111540 RepID=UPI002D780A9C|nr:NlpC/P60 family protein [Sinanaerobacter sp. ZZT-01]WRR94238.1 NlpC/P60 family protein [Sinanaerobacter sp. ZZT-01]